jgi:hypothetical protein
LGYQRWLKRLVQLLSSQKDMVSWPGAGACTVMLCRERSCWVALVAAAPHIPSCTVLRLSSSFKTRVCSTPYMSPCALQADFLNGLSQSSMAVYSPVLLMLCCCPCLSSPHHHHQHHHHHHSLRRYGCRSCVKTCWALSVGT